MKYKIKQACGHTLDISLFGSFNDRERKSKWFESQRCQVCEAEYLEKKYNLPALTGSEKQIIWAQKLRKKLIESLKRKFFSVSQTTDPEIMLEKCLANAIRPTTDARTWIDLRFETKKETLEKMYKKIQEKKESDEKI